VVSAVALDRVREWHAGVWMAFTTCSNKCCSACHVCKSGVVPSHLWDAMLDEDQRAKEVVSVGVVGICGQHLFVKVLGLV
jgi:hypothetical protein